MTAFGTSVLIAALVFCLLTTWASGTEPGRFAGRLGLTLADAGGANEIRAQYAGFFLAIALLCAAALADLASRQAAFITLVVTFGGLFAGRMVSLFLNRGWAGYGPTIRALLLIDLIGLSLAVAALVVDGMA